MDLQKKTAYMEEDDISKFSFGITNSTLQYPVKNYTIKGIEEMEEREIKEVDGLCDSSLEVYDSSTLFQKEQSNMDKEMSDLDPELALLGKINPDFAARKIISSKKLRKIFGVEMHPYVRQETKVGRNELCPCGSRLKYKKCCGK